MFAGVGVQRSMRRILIDAQPGEIRAAVLADGTLIDLLIERADRPNPVGGRYLGRVVAFDDSLQAAFVDIGLDRPGLLPRKNAMSRLSDGDRAVVRVVRPPAPGKGVKLKQDIPDPDETAGRVPRQLSAPLPLADFIARHAPADIRVAGEVAMARLQRQAPRFAATATAERLDADPFYALGLDTAIDALLSPMVTLSNGGRLWIEPVRTLTAVDVDTGEQAKRTGVSGLSPAAANRAAIAEIVRQTQLRALSGLIVVDFLEVETKQVRTEIAEALASAFANDPVRTDVGPMRASGLVEISRERVRPPLHEVLLEPCGRSGSGYVARADTAARWALRALAREALARPGTCLGLRVAPAVAAALADSVRPAREALGQRLGYAPPVLADSHLEREAWEITEAADAERQA